MIFSVKKKNGFLGILGPPYCGIGATIRIGREMLCVLYAGFLVCNPVTGCVTVLFYGMNDILKSCFPKDKV